MAIFDIFSKRQKALRGEVPDVYTYDEIPQSLRIQVVHIVTDALGQRVHDGDETTKAYTFVQETLCREYGRFTLTDEYDRPEAQVLNFLLNTDDVEEFLDTVELAFRYILLGIKPNYGSYTYSNPTKITPDEAISDLNIRFKENGIGYSFDGGEIIRVDSTYTHSQIVKPTISLLWNVKFQGANEEYMKAHEHYRHGRNKECLSECLKALESTLKVICTEKGWTFAPTDTAKKLIQVCFQNGLVPSFTQGQFTSLTSLIESGVPTIRNKLGGHGQGQVPQSVDDGITRYALNLTGSNIIFLIEQSGL
jgi:hypothetical protein